MFQVRVWDLHSGTSLLWPRARDATAASLTFHPYEPVLAVACAHDVTFWNWTDMSRMMTWRFSTDHAKVRWIRFSPQVCFGRVFHACVVTKAHIMLRSFLPLQLLFIIIEVALIYFTFRVHYAYPSTPYCMLTCRAMTAAHYAFYHHNVMFRCTHSVLNFAWRGSTHTIIFELNDERE